MRRARSGMIWRAAGASIAVALAAAARAQDFATYHGDPIPPEVEAAYVRGLNFLAKAQSQDGSWQESGGEGQAGVAGLATLAVLAHGDDPNFGTYAGTVRRAIRYILGVQQPNNGYIGPSMYHHGFATLALAESYGVVREPRIGPALKKAVQLILTSQAANPNKAWRYSPEATDADTTVSGAQVVALLAARNAGLGVPDQAIAGALQFYAQAQSGDGGIGYTGPDGGGSGARTAIGVLVAALARERETRLFKRAFRNLVDEGEASSGGYLFYYLYYAAQAYFHADMAAWRGWNAKNTARLLQSQGADGSWEGPNGRVFCTATALLSLALNYRYLPIYER